MPTETTTSTLEAALDYARRGWRVFPVHTVRNGQCSCGKMDCRDAGKHPRTKHGLKDATTDPAIIEQWAKAYPGANVGIATGKGSGLVALDVDPRHGGDESLRDLIARIGPLPDTVEVKTGGGGRHLYFAHPGNGLDISTTVELAGLPGLDIRGDGGYVVAPPSLHSSGSRYEWEASSHPDDVRLAPMPANLLALILANEGNSHDQPTPIEGKIAEGTRNATLARYAGALRRPGLDQVGIAAALVGINATVCDPPLSEDEVRAIARSVSLYPAEPAGVTGAPPVERFTSPATLWPDPLAGAAYHGLAGDMVRVIGPHTEADPAAILLQMLAAYGNVVGRGPHFMVEADRHGVNEYLVLVGTTSKGRKGTSWGHVRAPFGSVDKDWESQRIQSGLSSGEGLIWAVRDRISKTEAIRQGGRPTGQYEEVISDPGVTDKRLLVLEDEFASTLKVLAREGNTLSPVIRRGWDNGNLRAMTKNSPAVATGAHISIVAHITKDELRRYLDTTEAGNGFANRFLWACVRRSKCLPEGGSMGAVDMGPMVRRLSQAVEFGKKGTEIRRDESARAMWREVYPELSEGKPGLLGAVISRAEAHVARLSCIYALLDTSCVVRTEHLLAALAIWEYCEASARFIFGDTLGDPVADELLKELKGRATGMKRIEMRDHFGRNKSSQAIESALQSLAEHGLATKVIEKTGGRDAERWIAVRLGTTYTTETTKARQEDPEMAPSVV